ncbi:MAG: hypothetical protein NVS9B7_21520 [Flavisolibacter sp.]
MALTPLILLLGSFVLIIGGLMVGGYLRRKTVPLPQYEALLGKCQELQLSLAVRLTREEVEKEFVSRQWFQQCKEQLSEAQESIKQKDQQIIELTSESEQKISKGELHSGYVGKETYNLIAGHYQCLQVKSLEENKTIIQLTAELIKLKNEKENLDQKLNNFNEELTKLQQLSKDNFKNLAHEIFLEKSRDFSQTSKESLDKVLDPFKLQLDSFQNKIEQTRKEDIHDLTSLKKEIENLHKLNGQLSEDAQKLAGALKSDVKIQGNWGEDRLAYILEAEGLTRYLDYSSQGAFKDEQQDVNRKPDYILHLPDGNHIIIDSKVSLNAYVEFFNCTSEKKQYFLKQLVRHITDHIDILAAKNYQSLTGLNAPDFVCMFMGIEPALSLAISEQPDIIKRAMDKKIVIITPTTTMATLKMIKLLWQKENRVKNVEEIFIQCGALYDKFVRFVEEFQKIGANLDAASQSYHLSMNRLKEGQRKGDTILGKFETIKALEAKTNKNMPPQLLKEINHLDEPLVSFDDSKDKPIWVADQLT